MKPERLEELSKQYEENSEMFFDPDIFKEMLDYIKDLRRQIESLNRKVKELKAKE